LRSQVGQTAVLEDVRRWIAGERLTDGAAI
jgi:hypothetical protein